MVHSIDTSSPDSHNLVVLGYSDIRSATVAAPVFAPSDFVHRFNAIHAYMTQAD
jgi:hypothetical protein